MKRTKKGFTLVELLVVIAILAILASVSVVGYTAFISKANNSVALQELTHIRNALIAEDITNDGFDLSDGEVTGDAETEGTEAYIVKTFVGTLGLEGDLTYEDGVYTYTLTNGGEATWDIETNEVK